VLAGGKRREVDRFDVLAVGLDQLHPVGERTLAEFVDRERQMLLRRGGLGPAVVLEDEDRRNLPELCQVHRLVERSCVRGAVAEECDCDALFAAHLKRECRAHDPGYSARDDRVRAQVSDLDVVEMHRAAVAVRAALDLSVQLRHDPFDRRSLRDRMSVGAMRRGDHVLALEGGAHSRRDGLLPYRDVQESRQLAGPKALLHLLLEAPDQQHLAEEPAQTLFRDPPSAGAGLLLDRGHEPAIMLIHLLRRLFARRRARVASGR